VVVNFLGQIMSFPTYNGSPVLQARNYSSFYMGWVIRMKIKIAVSVCRFPINCGKVALWLVIDPCVNFVDVFFVTFCLHFQFL
jgi:hypothetical protein